MKKSRIFKISLVPLLFTISLVSVSRYTGWSQPYSKTVTQGINDPLLAEEIEGASSYLSTVPKKLQVPSISVAVGIDNQLVWSSAVGWADIKNNIAATPSTKYRVGSTSKAITATGVARLVESKRLDLDDSIGHQIPNYPQKKWNFNTRQLLSHTAGVGNYHDFGLGSAKTTLCNCRQFDSVEEGLDVFNRYDLIFRPGTDFAYSSFDVILASAVIEMATEQPFLAYMEEEVFEQLNMSSTLGDHSQPKIENLATFYRSRNGKFKEWKNLFGLTGDINLSYKWAGGGFLSTPSDLVTMGNAWLNDTTFISQNTFRTFFEPQKLLDGQINEQQYALGWRSYYDHQSEFLPGVQDAVWMVHHGGVSKGSMNFLVMFPEYNMVINASINARAARFGEFWREVLTLANFFLEDLERNDLEHLKVR